VSYKPTEQDALAAYLTAAAAHHLLPPDEIDYPPYAQLTNSPFGAFQVPVGDLYDDNGDLVYDEEYGWPLYRYVSCLYDRKSRRWLVSLQDDTVVSVRDTGDGFVVVADE
jgi:hypothetical protein